MSGRALWIWEHLPKNLEETNDKSWLNEGDAVENVNRLKIGKMILIFIIKGDAKKITLQS